MSLGPCYSIRAVATGVTFSQFKERGAMNVWYLRATRDEEMRKSGPVPSGCGENWATLRCRVRIWNHQTLHPPPIESCMVQFSLATPSAPIVLTGPNAPGSTGVSGEF
uniref:Uncharacterized protein n=1 Tax=mine drainage metagenome TaxID=410659 RepID=E6QJQ7_9ZZZZ